MKIALVNPPLRATQQYGSLASLAPDLPLLGPAFLSSFLSKHDVHVELLDLSTETFRSAIDDLRGYDVIGFTSFITNRQAILDLIPSIKTPKNIIVIGGPHATLFPEDFAVEGIDYIVSGDGELPLLEIISATREQRVARKMAGLAFRDEDKWSFSGLAHQVDLDQVGPPDIFKYKLNKYRPPVHIRGHRVIHTMTARGCPYKCAFCAAAEIMGHRIRYRALEEVIEELKHYRRIGYDSVMFYDDVFTLNKKRAGDLCKLIIDEKLDLHWCCFTRTDCLDPSLLSLMKKSGCYLITFGCESVNNKTLKILQKNLTHEKNIEGIEMVRNAGISSSSSFMIGLPEETLNDIEATVRFAASSKLTFAVFPVFEPFRGTAIYEFCKKTGDWKIDGNQNSISDEKGVWTPFGINRCDIERMARKAFVKFYTSPRRACVLMAYLITLPLARTYRFFIGGLGYFANRVGRQHNSHY